MADENVWQRDHAERAVLEPDQRVAVLPTRLQGAEGPAESLADKHAGSFRSFRPRDGFFLVVDVPADAANSDGEVGVFGYGVCRDSSGIFEGFLAPGVEGAGGDAVAVE